MIGGIDDLYPLLSMNSDCFGSGAMNQENAYSELSRDFYTVFMGGVLKRPLLVVLIIMVITIVFGWRIPQISFRTSIYDMVVDSLPETARYHTFKEVFGSDELIRIVIKTDGIFIPRNFSVVEEMSGIVEQIPGVRRVISLPVIKKAVEMSRKWDLQKFRETIQPVTLFKRNLTFRQKINGFQSAAATDTSGTTFSVDTHLLAVVE